MTDIQVTKNEERSRYEAVVDGEVAGFATYVLKDDVIVFPHTETQPQFEGRGIGSAIVRASLDDVRATGGLRVVPSCPFYEGWIVKHPEYADLTEGDTTAPMS